MVNSAHAPVARESRARDGDDGLLQALRSALRDSFPALPVSTLLTIARRSGAQHFPPGFLVAGALTDRSASGPRALLRRLARGDEAAPVHPLFSAEFYRLANPDLAGASVAAWQHYQVYGRVEGRSPHPLIEVKYLASALEGVPRSEVLDRYLADPQLWTAEPGPYVDCLRFMLLGEWDHRTNPLLQIVSEQLRSHWVHSRLMLVDSASRSETTARLAATGFLLSRGEGQQRLARLERWGHDTPARGRTDHVVVPGFILATGGTVAATAGCAAVSPDGSVVRVATETIAVRAGVQLSAPRLYWFDGFASREHLERIVREESGAAILAPSSPAQETSLRQIRRDADRPGITVLAVGAQASVDAAEVVVVPADRAVAAPEWDWSTAHSTGVAIVLDESHRLRATGDSSLRAALAAGAELCLVTDGKLNSWLPQMQARATVVVDPCLLESVASFVSEHALHTLPLTDGRAS